MKSGVLQVLNTYSESWKVVVFFDSKLRAFRISFVPSHSACFANIFAPWFDRHSKHLEESKNCEDICTCVWSIWEFLLYIIIRETYSCFTDEYIIWAPTRRHTATLQCLH